MVEYSEKKEIRQLQVLAGDYFSSQCYYLLTMNGDIEAIRGIASSVRKINQQKVLYYQAQDLISDDLIQRIAFKSEIESALFYGFIEADDQVWWQVLQDFMQLELLHQNEEGHYWNKNIVHQLINTAKKNIKDNLTLFNNDEVAKELSSILLHYDMSTVPTLVGEEI